MTMTDTEKSQAKYPQPKSQAKGCGFPAARIVCGFSLSTGASRAEDLEQIVSPPKIHITAFERQTCGFELIAGRYDLLVGIDPDKAEVGPGSAVALYAAFAAPLAPLWPPLVCCLNISGDADLIGLHRRVS